MKDFLKFAVESVNKAREVCPEASTEELWAAFSAVAFERGYKYGFVKGAMRASLAALGCIALSVAAVELFDRKSKKKGEE